MPDPPPLLPPNPPEDLPAVAPPDVEPRGLQLTNIDIKAHEAKTARTLTFVVVAMLGASIVLQYGTMGLLTFYGKSEAIPNFEHLFNAVLPVLAGLTGSAVTYYLTKEKK
jgi:hypothetical protein